MIVGFVMIAVGLAMAAADRPMERRFNSNSLFPLLWELAAFMLVIGGLVHL